jgi:cobalt/nickel transport system permease protein
MHIPDALLSAPVAAASGVVAAGGLAYGLKRLEGELRERTTVLMGVMSAFVFAAQMVNFPVGPGVSGHLLGGVLAAVMLGPWAGAVVIAAVLIVQCLIFGDGGLTALGANFINMGLIGSVGGYAIYDPIRCALGGRRGVLIGSMAAAWFSVLLASGAFAVELAVSGQGGRFLQVLGWMALVHAAIGVGEALITGMVVRFILLARPDLVYDPKATVAPSRLKWASVVGAGLGIALAVAVFLSPLASEKPDGLEYVMGAKIGLLNEDAPPVVKGIFPDYKLTLPGAANLRENLLTPAAGLAGTCLVFAVAFALARVFAQARLPEPLPDAP